MLEVRYFPNNSLPTSLLKEGLIFIRRRFQEVWGIYRSDVTIERIKIRKNFIIFDYSKLVGWLGLEDSGELTNACIKKTYKGVENLIFLIKKSYEFSPQKYLYARVPIHRTAPALAFLKAGMKLSIPPELTQLKYLEKEVILVKLFIFKKDIDNQVSDIYIEKALQQIRELEYVKIR